MAKLWFYLHWHATKSMALLPAHRKTLSLLTLASYQIYGFAPQGIAKLWSYAHRQATKSMVLLARVKQNYDFTHIGKLPNLWCCSPGHWKTKILSTLASYQIYGFVCQSFTYIGKLPNLWFCFPGPSKTMIFSHWQATKSTVLLARE